MKGYTPPSTQTLTWVARQLHPRARVERIVRLHGGITAAMDRLTIGLPTGAADVVLRRWPDEAWADGRVECEAAGLESVSADENIPAPRLLAMDALGHEAGVRCTLTSALVGHPDLVPADQESWLRRLAVTQAAIHTVPYRHPDAGSREDGAPGSVPDRFSLRDRHLAWLADEGLRSAAVAAATDMTHPEPVFIHGDYQHFNVLWSQGHLTGVVDWPESGPGDRGRDVGHCRLNLAVLFGTAAAAHYLTEYERAADVRIDRRADLRALLCFDRSWQEFIPHQVDGRAELDVAGMPDRVTATVRATLESFER